jgi:hypothetical protein
MVGGVYAVLLACKKSGIYIPYLSDFGADLLAIPFILTIALWAVRITDPRRKNHLFSPGYIAVAVLLIALLFEGLFPILSNRFTADPLDVLCYALGGLAFAWAQKRFFSAR